jgi:hypothetical protein
MRGHQTIGEAVKNACNPQTNRTPGSALSPKPDTGIHTQSRSASLYGFTNAFTNGLANGLTTGLTNAFTTAFTNALPTTRTERKAPVTLNARPDPRPPSAADPRP